mmetsp:Transcript_43936/g.91485  ORF Transcript_43936/g.91485 Transcript_43936/m.91485 type:complete len:106 (-) Transcript_43936:248-565(-)
MCSKKPVPHNASFFSLRANAGDEATETGKEAAANIVVVARAKAFLRSSDEFEALLLHCELDEVSPESPSSEDAKGVVNCWHGSQRKLVVGLAPSGATNATAILQQ